MHFLFQEQTNLEERQNMLQELDSSRLLAEYLHFKNNKKSWNQSQFWSQKLHTIHIIRKDKFLFFAVAESTLGFLKICSCGLSLVFMILGLPVINKGIFNIGKKSGVGVQNTIMMIVMATFFPAASQRISSCQLGEVGALSGWRWCGYWMKLVVGQELV